MVLAAVFSAHAWNAKPIVDAAPVDARIFK
jgi:hypothetical protein